MDPSFLKILIDGQELDQFSAEAILESVTVTQALNDHWYCHIECRQTEDRRFPIEDSLAKDLEVIAVDDAGKEVPLFEGFVLEADLEYELAGGFTARIDGVTKSYKMDLTPRQQYYTFGENTVQQVAEKLAGKAGLEVDFKAAEVRSFPPLVQWGETDFQFLRRLADDIDAWIQPGPDSKIKIGLSFEEGPTVQWRGEGELLNFRIRGKLGQPSMDGSHYNPFQAESKDFTKVEQEESGFLPSIAPMVDAVKQGSKKVLPTGYVHQRARATALDAYEALLKKECRRAIGGKISCHGISRQAEICAGKLVTIEGTLDAQGDYGVTKVVHRWTPVEYLNEFWCTPWVLYCNPDPPEMRLWHGVVPARVVDNNDPRNMGRLRVQFYWQEENESFWMRMVTPHAGGDRGFYFIPDIGDEVLVAFEDGDPERPIVLGSLWNDPDNAPKEEFWGADVSPNDVKRIVTKSGHRFHMVDKEGKEAIGLATPKHTKIVMFEKTDETGRPAINICAKEGDIILSAPNGRIHFHSKFFSREIGPA